jgi:monofunctional biosynthetic peptidoglycan transglycosylase
VRGIALGAALFFLWLVAVWPPPIWYRWFWPRQTAFMSMRARDWKAMASHPERRSSTGKDGRVPRLYQPIPMSEMASALRPAALVAEDHRFYEHGGIDYQAIREAMGYRRDSFSWSDAKDRAELERALSRAWDRRERIRGASTITQQLAKNLYLSPSRNPLRKIKEALTACRLEWALSKDRLLELYLNVVELGPEVWGVEAASRFYFNRPAKKLTTEQAAALAASLPFPLRSNPGYRTGRMRWRQDLILRRLRGEVLTVPPDTEVPDREVKPDTAVVLPEPDSVETPPPPP